MKSKRLEGIVERRRMEGSSLQLDVMQQVLELVVHERMSQSRGVKGLKEKKKVSGWSAEEMREKPNIAPEEDDEEVRKWRGPSQSEIGQCWKNLAERMEEDVFDKNGAKESKSEASEVEGLFWNGGVCAK